MGTYKIHATPNPNSMKITTQETASFVDEGMVSFGSKQEAASHPLGKRLFSVQGIANVFAMPQFVTVTKHPAADWNIILPQVEEALDQYFNS